jgi:hypothetical protein
MSYKDAIRKVAANYEALNDKIIDYAKSPNDYNIKYLYSNIAKNAHVIANSDDFPAIKLNKKTSINQINNKKTVDFNFSNSPEFSKVFNQNRTALSQLANIPLSIKDEAARKNYTPCLKLMANPGEGETLTDYLGRKKGKTPSYRDRMSKGIDNENLQRCQNIHCKDCKECKPHQQELIKAINGILDDKPGSDDRRQMHIKNLFTTLDSWSAHQDSRGNDKDTCKSSGTTEGDPYFNDAKAHNMAASEMRVLKIKLQNAYEEDYRNSDQKGGGVHRDFFGETYGKNRDVY